MSDMDALRPQFPNDSNGRRLTARSLESLGRGAIPNGDKFGRLLAMSLESLGRGAIPNLNLHGARP